MQKSQRLMWKIFIYLSGFCVLLLLILWLLQTVFLGQIYEHVRKGEIKKAIILVEENINSPDLNQLIRTLAEDQEIIVTPALDFVPPARPGPRDKPPFREAITERRDFITAEGNKISFVFYAIISPVTATISTIKYQLYYVTLIMVFLSAGLALVIARMVAKPIEGLNESAKIMASGDYEINFSGQGYKEIDELSETLNYTAAELSKVEKLRRELMANISHDLRTPLALIYSYAEMMNDFPDEISQEQTQLIMDESQRLSSLVNDILDVSHLENGVQSFSPQKYNLTLSLKKTIENMEKLLERQAYIINFDYKEEIEAEADEKKITQAFYNLLVNAVHYSNSENPILVRQRIEGDFVKIEVEDFGSGIEKENLPHIWDRYYRTEESHKRAILGTGLGLSIVKNIIELHSGTYGAESKEEGSIFWFCLPLK